MAGHAVLIGTGCLGWAVLPALKSVGSVPHGWYRLRYRPSLSRWSVARYHALIHPYVSFKFKFDSYNSKTSPFDR
jgi:hypothetical protein